MPSSIAGGLRRPEAERTSLNWAEGYHFTAGDRREPAAAEARRQAYEENHSVSVELVSQWPPSLVEAGWHWSPSELLGRIQEKVLQKASVQAGSGLGDVHRYFVRVAGSGRIDQAAFREGLRRLGIELSTAGVKVFFDVFDSNRDGLLEMADFSEAFFPTSGLHSVPRMLQLKQRTAEPPQTPAEDKRRRARPQSASNRLRGGECSGRAEVKAAGALEAHAKRHSDVAHETARRMYDPSNHRETPTRAATVRPTSARTARRPVRSPGAASCSSTRSVALDSAHRALSRVASIRPKSASSKGRSGGKTSRAGPSRPQSARTGRTKSSPREAKLYQDGDGTAALARFPEPPPAAPPQWD